MSADRTWSLVVESEGGSSRRLAVRDSLVIGRDADGEGQILGDSELSRRHAEVRAASDGGLVVEDLDSANGTRVNGIALTPSQEHELEVGDVVIVGQTTLRVDGPAVGIEEDDAAKEAEPETEQAPAAAGEAEMPTEEASAAARAPEPAAAAAQVEGPPAEQRGSPSSIRPIPVAPPAQGAPSAEILYEEQRFPIPPKGLRIGRAPENDLAIDSPTLSREHAIIGTAEGRDFVADLGTRNGTELNGERIREGSRWLHSGDTIELGGHVLRYVAGEGTDLRGRSAVDDVEPRVVHPGTDRLTLGRDPSNDVVLDDPNVSRFHAEIRRAGNRFELRDLGSANGTRLNREFVRQKAALTAGDEVGIGPFRLVFDGSRFVHRDDRGALRLTAEDVSTVVGGKTILNRASITVEPGEFVVIIGASGSGKTTLVKALAGVSSPSGGEVKVSGEPVATRLTDIGYVPQDEIVHRRLTVAEALRFSAALRLPKDATEADVREAMDRVVDELSLDAHTATLIASLSGGQRKRVGVGTELLNRPSLLLLDEPTTGLDPGLETRLMELFRVLAEEGKRAVTVVTHATKNLDLADKVCVMGSGELCYYGPTDEARDFFSVKTYDGIYDALEERSPAEWRQEFEAQQERDIPTTESRVDAQLPAVAGLEAPRPRSSFARQTALLARRYFKLMMRDRRNLTLLLGQVPLIALGIAILFSSNVLASGAAGDPNNAALLVFLVVTTAIWLGSIDGSREIIKERALFEREKAVGVKLSAYLSSKAIVLFALVGVQCIVLVGIVFGLRSLHEPASHYLEMLAVLMMTGFVAVSAGLLISALVSSEDQAASLIPLALIPQLLFAGAIVAVKSMTPAVKVLSGFVFSRWAFAGSGRAAGIGERIVDKTQAQANFAQVDRYGSSFFSHAVSQNVLILFGFLALGAVVIYTTLALQTRRR